VVHLLPLVDPRQDMVLGPWSAVSGELRAEPGPRHNIIQLPYRPPEEYDFLVEFTRLDGRGDIALVLTRGGHSFKWCAALDNRYFGFELVGGKALRQLSNRGDFPGAVENGRRHVALVRVRRGGLKAFIDGRLVSELATDGSDLSMFFATRLRDETLLGLTSFTNHTVFHKIDVFEVSGPGTITRTAEGWIDLFNGKDLSGWETVGPVEWTADKGVLRTRGSGGQGWLATDRDYDNFEIELEYRLGPGANTGVFVHAWKEGPLSGSQFLEIQIIDDETHKTIGKLNGTAAIFGVVAPNPTVQSLPGRWHKTSIQARGRRVQIAFEGKQVVDANLDDHAALFGRFPGLKRTTGRIGLQHYGSLAEFRNIRLRPLSP
jgi:hypothetical protein